MPLSYAQSGFAKHSHLPLPTPTLYLLLPTCVPPTVYLLPSYRYVHLVQLLVDTLVLLAPFALYPKLGVLTVLLSGILVIFYRGFLQVKCH